MKLTRTLFLAPAAAVLLAGCNFAPPYTPPRVETSTGFKETNGWKMAEPDDAAIKGDWWKAFNDSNLNELEPQVAVSNQNVIAALENFMAARAVARQARAALFPTLTLDPLAEKTHNSHGSTTGLTTGNSSSTGAPASATSSSSGTTSLYELPADASWEPDLWGSLRNTMRQNAYAAQASAAQLENMKLSLQSELAVDYFQLRAQDELIEVYSNTVQSYSNSLALTRTLAETGIDSELDVAQADSLLETTLAQATALWVTRAQLEHAVAMLVGKPPAEFSLTNNPLRDRPPQIPVSLPAQLLERRPDIAAAERAVAEANAGIGVARAAYFPTVTLTGGAGFQNSAIGSLLNASSFYWSVGGELSETVFDAGRRQAVNQQAWAVYRGAVATYRQTALTAFQQVEDNLAALRILDSESQQQDVAIRAAQKNLDLSMERYRLGINSYLNVITAQITLLQNQQSAVSIQSQQMSSAVQLITALGGGWNQNELPATRRVLNGPPPTASEVLAK